MKIYAVAHSVLDPEDERYITPGKEYEVLSESKYGQGFYIFSDSGNKTFCLWDMCEHIGGNWERIER